jgi:DNA-binding SARP family transcriptional activator
LVADPLARAIDADIGPPGLAARLAARAGGEVLDRCSEVLVAGSAAGRARLLDALDTAGVVDPENRDRLGLGTSRPPRGPKEVATRPPLRIAALGGFSVRRGDETIPVSAFGRERARALLGALVCVGGPVHRERLLEWLWPDLDMDRGLRALHVTLHALRRALEPELGRGATSRSVIRSEGEGYRLVLAEGDTIDVAEFLGLIEPVPAETPRQALTRLAAAERAHTGALYPEWPYADWAVERQREVEQAYSTVLAGLADHFLTFGQHREALLRFERLVAIEPEREAFHRSLMLIYAYTGEKALALRQYHACRAVLRRELGVEASTETRALYQLILEDRPVPAPGTPVLDEESGGGLPEGTVTIMFADIADSTGLTERLGDAAFRSRARTLEGSVRVIIEETGGVPVEGRLLGDGLMAVFTSARQAIECGVRVSAAADETSLGLHLGLHAGDVIREDGNVFGGAVNIAARVAALASPGEVLVSETVRSLARTSANVTFESRGSHALKGVEDPHSLFAIVAAPDHTDQ